MVEVNAVEGEAITVDSYENTKVVMIAGEKIIIAEELPKADENGAVLRAESGKWITEKPDTEAQMGSEKLITSGALAEHENKENPHDITAEMLGALEFKKLLTSADDMDDVVESGVYVYSTVSVPKNAPFANAAVIFVFGSDSKTTQTIQLSFRYGTAGQGKFRPLLEGKWQPYSQFVMKNEMYYESGDYFTSGSLLECNGYISGSSAQLYIFVPLSKLIDTDTVSKVEVTKCVATIRGVSGYMGSSGTNFADGTYTLTTRIYENGVLLGIKTADSSAFSNSVNNTPIAVQFNSLQFYFTA